MKRTDMKEVIEAVSSDLLVCLVSKGLSEQQAESVVGAVRNTLHEQLTATEPANRLPLKEFKVKWCKCPTNYNDTQIMVVEALSAGDAKKLATDAIERRGIEWFVVGDVYEAEKLPQGRVL